jgi:excisionase family DNA binding protein
MNERTKSETFEYALGVRQVAKRYRVTKGTVYNWIKADKMPYLRLPGGDYRFKECHLEEFDRRRRGNFSSRPDSDSLLANERSSNVRSLWPNGIRPYRPRSP